MHVAAINLVEFGGMDGVKLAQKVDAICNQLTLAQSRYERITNTNENGYLLGIAQKRE